MLHLADQVAILDEPAPQPRPRSQQRFVRDLDGGLTRRRIAIGDEQPMRLEQLRDRNRAIRQIAVTHAPPRVLVAVTRNDQTQQQLARGLLGSIVE